MELNPWYVSGFIDGEGSFLVSFSVREKLTLGVEARPSFTVSQHQRNKAVLDALRPFFGCGTVRFNTSDGTYKYEVRNLEDLLQKIIPHFERYPLQTSKQKDFEALRRVCHLKYEDCHLSIDGLRQIIEIAYQMNNFGARRYSKDQLLKVCRKMKV